MQVGNAFADDPQVGAFLEAIGVPESVRRLPQLTTEVLEASHVNIHTLRALASSELDSPVARCYGDTSMAEMLNPREAARALALLQQHGSRLRDLFDTRRCPGSGTTAPTILMNLMHVDRSRIPQHGGPHQGVNSIEAVCTTADHRAFGPVARLGIHYLDHTVWPALRAQVGEAVVPLFDANQHFLTGGILALVPHMDTAPTLLTALHVVAEKQKREFLDPNTGFSLLRDIRPFTYGPDPDTPFVTPADLTRLSNRHDFVSFALSDGAASPAVALPVATHPPLPGEVVWVVGFPQNTSTAPPLRTYTQGIVTGYHDGQLTLQSRIYHGNSGGAVVDGAFALVGVLQYLDYVPTTPDDIPPTHCTKLPADVLYVPCQHATAYLPPDYYDPKALILYDALVAFGANNQDLIVPWADAYDRLESAVHKTYPEFFSMCSEDHAADQSRIEQLVVKTLLTPPTP